MHLIVAIIRPILSLKRTGEEEMKRNAMPGALPSGRPIITFISDFS
jgi:hypothetical protein